MASVYTISFFTIILVLQAWSASSSNLSSIFSPFFGDICKSSDQCGKGTCKPSNQSTFGFVCECEAGWKQARADNDDDLKFLPCVIPNCTLDYTCSGAPSPAPQVDNRANKSFFDPCFWTDCGGGTCNKTSPFTHTCECQEGYYNILNISSLPCLRDCALGVDCKRLGIDVSNKSTSGDICKSSDQCGKGTCKPSNQSTFGFVCDCEAGWKQARADNDDDHKFLPCVIPNCTLDYTCSGAPSPAPQVDNRANKSFFDPCFWTDCGGGTCNKTSPFTHKCECQEGYYNILNSSALPCFRDCALGVDCKSLGIGVSNKSTSPSSSENSPNQARSIHTCHLSWLIFGSMFLALVLWI